MSALWSVLFGFLFLKKHGQRVALVMGAAVFSHFLLDVPMHPPDIALWPHSTTHIGFGLWRALPNGWWFVELAVVTALWAYYASRSRRSSTFGGKPVAIGVVLLLIHIFNSPWASPL